MMKWPFHHMAEMLYSLIDGQQLVIVSAVLLLGQVEFLGKKARGCQAFLTHCCSTADMVDVEASMTIASDILHEVPKGLTYKETVRALEDQFGDQHLAVGYLTQLKT
jgi:hypothetical protein